MKRLLALLLALIAISPAYAIEKNVASQRLEVQEIDSATGAPKTGDAAQLTAYASLDGGTLTALTDTSATESSSTNAPGVYWFDLAQAETNGTNILFTGKSSTSGCYIVPRMVATLPSGLSTITIANNATAANVTRWLGTTAASPATAGIPDVNIKNINNTAAATPGTAGGVLIAGTNAATIFTSSTGPGLLLASTGSNGNGLLVSGNGTGAGVKITGGASGDGLTINAGGSSGNGATISATNGDGVDLTAGGSGNHGFKLTGGGGTGNDLKFATPSCNLLPSKTVYIYWATDATTSGTALRSAIQGGAAGTHFIVGPGNYDTGTGNAITMPNDCVVTGSGRESTCIIGSASGPLWKPGTRTTTEHLTINNSGGFGSGSDGTTQFTDAVLSDVRLIGSTDVVNMASSNACAIHLVNCYGSGAWDGLVASGAAHTFKVQNMLVALSGTGGHGGGGITLSGGSTMVAHELAIDVFGGAANWAVSLQHASSRAEFFNCHLFAYHGAFHKSVIIGVAGATAKFVNCEYDRGDIDDTHSGIEDVITPLRPTTYGRTALVDSAGKVSPTDGSIATATFASGAITSTVAPNLDVAVSSVSGGGGDTITPFLVGKGNFWKFDNANQLIAPNTISKNIGFQTLLFEMDVSGVIADSDSVTGTPTVTIADVNGATKPTVGTVTLRADKKAIDVELTGTSATAATYTVSFTFNTVDTQQQTLKGRLLVQ